MTTTLGLPASLVGVLGKRLFNVQLHTYNIGTFSELTFNVISIMKYPVNEISGDAWEKNMIDGLGSLNSVE